MSKSHWSKRKERGASWGLSFMLTMYKLMGPRVTAWFLYPVISYFYLTSKQSKQASRDYLARISPHQQLSSFKHFMCFGHAALDKVSVWCGLINQQHLKSYGNADVLKMLERGQGGVFLCAHLGNIEICRALSDVLPGLKINALVFTKNAVKFNNMLAKIAPTANLNLIQLDNVGPDTAIMLAEKIAAGEFIAIMADRTSTQVPERSIGAPFLGETAYFPQGPFILASLLKCPVFSLFCQRIDQHFEINAQLLSPKLVLRRQQRQQDLAVAVGHYAEQLEIAARKTPYQWFNFFNFWQKTP
ncbi:acyltransferase [Motilimonas cestriensis]|uniref:LpxL/LpxP family acyltransferase n=1 Tax=Motilimonas cestriensis TaxID=2742685 RepID=UPI003DA25F84